MTLVEKRALAIWEMMMGREERGEYTVDVGWSEEDFVSDFAVRDHTTIILLEGNHYARSTVAFLLGDEALNVQLALEHLEKDVERCSRGYPIYIHHDFVKHEVYMFQSEKEARSSQLHLIGNSLPEPVRDSIGVPSGFPMMETDEGLIVSTADMLRFHYQDETIDYLLDHMEGTENV